MKAYRLSFLARLDLVEIWDYSRDQWGKHRAKAYLRTLQSTIQMIAEHPDAGSADETIGEGYRRRAVGSHVVFYRIERHVEIVRVLHQSMDPKTHLG
jgi:toxin ParE1/3/4